MAYYHRPSPDAVLMTENYSWSLRDQLGYGATGSVFVGYNRNTGDRVAVKQFGQAVDFKTLKREIDVVRSLPPHENIVQLLSYEEEPTTHGKVIIMELCTGGSLYEVIDSFENSCGLNETEFKQVMYDVASGLAHLRKHNFIHRDIKPGNIMRCSKLDGSYCYKLADFGTARELGDEETFYSLHGTEEYLYPGMYERALVNPQKKKEFPAKVDLWSVGATFFHAATGRLPFQPYRKRDDRELMFQIISTKRSGVIYGWQLEPNGEIQYGTTLPRDTQISQGLKLLITPVLAGLMENDFKKMPSFDEFFRKIRIIMRMKVVDVFCVNSSSCHKIYMDRDEPNSVQKLKDLIRQQTDLSPSHQQLFYENLPFAPSNPLPASQLPNSSPERPFFVFGGDARKPSDQDYPPLPTVLPGFSKGLAIATDFHFAKNSYKLMFTFQTIVEKLEKIYKLTHQAALCYSHSIQHKFELLEQQLMSSEEVYQATSRVLSSQLSGLDCQLKLLDVINRANGGTFSDEMQALVRDCREKEAVLSKIRGDFDLMKGKISSRIRQEARGIHDSWDSHACSDVFYRSVETMKYLLQVVKDLYNSILKIRKMPKPSPHDQKVHEFNKEKIHRKLLESQDKVVRLISGRDLIHRKLGDWFLRAIPLEHDITTIRKELLNHSAFCRESLRVSDRWEEEHKTRVFLLQEKLAELVTSSGALLGPAATPLLATAGAGPTASLPRQLNQLQASTNGLSVTVDNHIRQLVTICQQFNIKIPEGAQTLQVNANASVGSKYSSV